MSSAQRTIENSPAIHRWVVKPQQSKAVKRATEFRLPLRLSSASRTLVHLLFANPALKCWATTARRLRRLPVRNPIRITVRIYFRNSAANQTEVSSSVRPK